LQFRCGAAYGRGQRRDHPPAWRGYSVARSRIEQRRYAGLFQALDGILERNLAVVIVRLDPAQTLHSRVVPERIFIGALAGELGKLDKRQLVLARLLGATNAGGESF